jgi:hypothetical protein
VEEKTGLQYASTVKSTSFGRETFVAYSWPYWSATEDCARTSAIRKSRSALKALAVN